MTTQEKLLEAAKAALHGRATRTLERHRLYEAACDMRNIFWVADGESLEGAYELRCLYLCFLAAAWEEWK